MDVARGDRAGERARQAGARLDELGRRRAELRAGRRVTPGDVARAAAAAAAAADKAYRAGRDAVNAYLSAAAAHHSAADRLERHGQSARARDHRDLASADLAAASVAQRAVDSQRPACPTPTQPEALRGA